MTVTRERYLVLVAIRDDAPYAMWPMMRRAFLREHLIEPNGETPDAPARRVRRTPKRPYLVTRRGRAKIREFEIEAGIVQPRRPRVLPMNTQIDIGQGR